MAEILALSLADARRDYDRDGYAIIPGVFSKEELGPVRIHAYVTANYHPHKAQWLTNGRPALLFWPQEIDRVLGDIVDDPRLARIVHEFLGPAVRQINNQIYFREPGDGDEFAWHQDILFRRPAADFSNVESNYLQTIIAVDAMTPENGTIEFIPGSHKRGDQNLLQSGDSPALRNFIRNGKSGIKVTAQPGDVIIWHSLVVHGSEKNQSRRARMTYMNGFAADAAVRNKEKYPPYEPRKSARGL